MLQQISKRWYDSGSNSVPMCEVTSVASSASIQQGQQIISLTFERESIDPKRAEDYDTQRTRLVLDKEAAQRIIKVLNEHIAQLEFYSETGRWPMIPELMNRL